MRLKEIEERLQAIEKELRTNENADVEVLTKETDELIEERKAILEKAEQRKATLDNIAQNHSTGTMIRTFELPEEAAKEEKAKVNEEIYTRAFLKDLIRQDMTAEERAVFLHTTENTSKVIPKALQDKIYTNMIEKHPILKDVKVLRSGAVISIVKHIGIAQGDAKEVAEGVANADEKNTFVNVELVGKDFSKHIDFSYRLGKMAIPAFEKYLVEEIANRLGSAMAKDIVAQIKTDLASENKFNVAKKGTLTLADVLKGLSSLKATNKVQIYMNNTTLYNNVAMMKDADTKVSFIADYTKDISAQLIGKPIKEEDALADGEILIIDTEQFIYNIVQDVTIERDKDIKKHVNTIAGFAIAGGTMTNDKAGCLITVGTAG